MTEKPVSNWNSDPTYCKILFNQSIKQWLVSGGISQTELMICRGPELIQLPSDSFHNHSVTRGHSMRTGADKQEEYNDNSL